MVKSFPPFGDRRKRRIGLLGGSFNPAHDGHVHISREAMKRLGLDQVWWLVSPQNPLKPKQGMATLETRLDAAHAATARTNIIVGDLESKIGAVRTAKVVTSLSQRFPCIEFVWLMGADNLEQFPRWWHWPDIFRRVRVAVLDRSPYAYRALAGAAAQRFRLSRTTPNRALFKHKLPAWCYLAIKRHSASSTAIRSNQITDKKQETPISPAKTNDDLESKVAAIVKSLDDDKGRDIVQLSLEGKTAMADCMVVASGTSTRQVTAMAEHLVTKLKSLGHSARSEGKAQGDWVLVDAGDVVVHLFRPEVRAFYDIERLWATAPAKGIVSKPSAAKPAATKPRVKTKAKAKKAPARKTARKKA